MIAGSRIFQQVHTLISYVEKQYNNIYHSSIKQKPIEKFLSNAQNLKFLKSKQELDYMFLYRVTRSVKNDSTISVDNIIYEVPGKDAISRLEFLKTTKGIGLITGEPGMGKSSLLRYFESTLNPNLYKCVYIPLSTLTVMDFYRALCDGLGIIAGFKKMTMFKQIQETIYNYSYNKNITPVIILAEAQFLKNSILDDLRIILNFNMDSKDHAILLLVGQTAFINQIQRKNHDALRQRIVVNYHLTGLTKEEVREYITSRLAFAGCTEPLFTDDAAALGFVTFFDAPLSNAFDFHVPKVNRLIHVSLLNSVTGQFSGGSILAINLSFSSIV